MINHLKDSLRNNTLIGNSRFKIIKTIGRGGFGFIYLATDANHKKYAIKEFFIDRGFIRNTDNTSVICDPNYNKNKEHFYRKMFKNEALLLRKLDHPNIIVSFEFFEENGTCYNVMPFIKGVSLSEHIKMEGSLSEVESSRIIYLIAKAIKYIHSKNICHFDIKPENIMLQNGNPILIDFGLSRNYTDSHLGESIFQTISTGYAPLELFEKNGINTFSPETDIFGLGATLYSMLTGETPPLLKSIWHGALLKNIKDLSDPLQMTIKTSMQIIPSRRFRSIDSFIQSLLK